MTKTFDLNNCFISNKYKLKLKKIKCVSSGCRCRGCATVGVGGAPAVGAGGAPARWANTKAANRRDAVVAASDDLRLWQMRCRNYMVGRCCRVLLYA